MGKDRHFQLYNDESNSWEAATEGRAQKTQSDPDDRESLDEVAIESGSDTDWESEIENNDDVETENKDDEKDEDVKHTFQREAVQKVEPRKSDLMRPKIVPKMDDGKKVKRRMMNEEDPDKSVRSQMLQIRKLHLAKGTVLRGGRKEDDTLQWPDESPVW